MGLSMMCDRMKKRYAIDYVQMDNGPEFTNRHNSQSTNRD